MKAIKGSGGVISVIADTLGVAWHTANKAIEENEGAKQALENEMERRLDLSESVLIRNIEMAEAQQSKGFFADTSDAKWYLSKKGKHRGYVDRQEVTGKDGEPLSPPQIIEVVKHVEKDE